MNKVAFAVVAGALAAVEACVGVGDERSRRDEDVGKAATGATAFEVVDGLASIRSLEPGTLSLWAAAPALRVRGRIGGEGPEEWVVSVANAMPDATLDAADAHGEALPVRALDGARPTAKRWSVTLPPGADVSLGVHPAREEPAGTWRFAVLSDVQEAIDRVQDIYARMNADPTIEFVASAGDLTQRGTPEQLERFQRELEQLRVPFFATLGNHELGNDDGAPFQQLFGRASFRFAYGGAQLTFVDSGSAGIAPRVYDWLTTWLDEGRQRAHAVLMHIPPIDPIGVRNGSFADRNEAAKLLAKLAGGGVDLTLYGHIHSYYAFSNAGIPAYISGGGGSIPERFDGIGRHYLTVDVDARTGSFQVGMVRIDGD